MSLFFSTFVVAFGKGSEGRREDGTKSRMTSDTIDIEEQRRKPALKERKDPSHYNEEKEKNEQISIGKDSEVLLSLAL